MPGARPVKAEAAEPGSWSGFYVGSYVGAALVNSSWGPAVGPLAPASTFDATLMGGASGAVVGTTVGYNAQFGAFVVGLEGDLGTGLLASQTHCLASARSLCAAQTDWLATVAGRLGYAFDNVLVYAKGGLALQDTDLAVTGSTYPGVYSGSTLQVGWTAGAGVEVALTDTLSAKAEYAYLGFGSDQVGLQNGLWRETVGLKQSTQMVKLGLNYRPWGAPLPGTGARLAVPGRDWSGLYLGLHAGGAWGRDEWNSATGFLAQATASGAMLGQGTAMGLLGGGQVGFNVQSGPWVAGVELSASAANLGGYAKCATNTVSGTSFACHNAVDSLGSIAGRLGQSWGDLLFYGKAGAAWATGSSLAFPTLSLTHFTGSGTRWGWMVGSGVEYALTQSLSAFLEYDFYDFGTNAVTLTGAGTSGTADLRQRLEAVRMGVNYRFGADPTAVAATRLPELPAGWTAEVGARYFGSTGRMQKDLMSAQFQQRLNSRLIYGNSTGQSLETFFRLENQNGLLLKGYAGLGTLAGGDLYDEDFPAGIAYSNTLSGMSEGQLAYGALDVGYELVRQGQSSLGAFIGYRAHYQKVNGFGCQQIAHDTTCSDLDRQGTPALVSSLGLSETDVWQALAIGLNSRLQLTDRLRLEVDAAYLPYAVRSGADNHWFRADINPLAENGHGWGTQLEAILSYAVTDRLDVGVGARYWYFASDEAATRFPGVPDRSPESFYSERYGAFLQASYRFGDIPPLAADVPVAKAEAPAMNWTALYAGGALGGGKGHSTYASPFAPPVSGDAVDLGGALAGGQLGADYQIGAMVIGAEASAAWSNILGTDTCFSTAPVGTNAGSNCGSHVRALGTLTGRVGYAFDRTLLFARGGFAWDRQTDTFNTFALNQNVLSNSGYNTGWTLGAGVEYALLPNLSVGLEYKHFDFGASATFTSATPAGLAGVDFAPDNLRLDLVAMSVNYRFTSFAGGQ